MNLLSKLITIIILILVSATLNAKFEVLDRPAIKSKLAEQSVLIDLVNHDNEILAVGERGHIINWQSPGQWQQHNVPVSVLLTAVTVLSDGTKVAVGHDSAILVSQPESTDWVKVFDGYKLLDLKEAYFEQQIEELTAEIEATEDDFLREDLEFNLEELTFSLDDTKTEQAEGPNKPLLSIAATPDDQLFVVGSYGTLLYSNDKGQTWTLQDGLVDNPDKFHLNSVVAMQNGRMYIVGENSTAFSSTDNGATWSRMNMPYEGSMFGVSVQENSDNLIAFGLQGNLMVSTDGGANWTLKRLETSASFQGGAIDANGKAYIVGHGGLVVDFEVADLSTLNIRKHPSGAAFAKPLIRDDALILVGQFGIITWPFDE